MNEFEDIFWPNWPNKKAKAAARKAFVKARKIASLETIMAGVQEYVAKKEDYRAWMHPATFLNGERWDDEYEQPDNALKRGLYAAVVAREPQNHTDGACQPGSGAGRPGGRAALFGGGGAEAVGSSASANTRSFRDSLKLVR